VVHNPNSILNASFSTCAPSNQGLILLGTVHSDPRGFSRTRAFLIQYKPDLILVEISPFAVEYRKQHARTLRKTLFCNLRGASERLSLDFKATLKNPYIADIILQISLPFEFRASVSYARHAGVKVVPVDYSEFSREWIKTWPELISSENLETLLQLEDSQRPVSQHYAEAALEIAGRSGSRDITAGKDFEKWQKREDYIAEAIRSQLDINEPSRPIYIGGWRHLVAKGRLKTIRDILGIEGSGCFLLNNSPNADQIKWAEAREQLFPRVASFTGKC
jgi:hypothetical protein